MKKTLALLTAFPLAASIAFAQGARPVNVNDIVDLGMLTHTELAQKMKDGWTSIFLVTGGTEERGPHDVLGGHNILAKNHATMAAKKLGKTLVAPIIPIAVNATGLNPNREMADQPGPIQMPAEVFKQVQIAAIDSLARSGFKDIYVMGDHGGGQNDQGDHHVDDEANSQDPITPKSWPGGPPSATRRNGSRLWAHRMGALTCTR